MSQISDIQQMIRTKNITKKDANLIGFMRYILANHSNTDTEIDADEERKKYLKLTSFKS